MKKRVVGMTEEQILMAEEAIQLAKKQGWEYKIVEVPMLHRDEVSDFIRKIERAHRNAGKSKLVFKADYDINVPNLTYAV